jgi:hypothetical protein
MGCGGDDGHGGGGDGQVESRQKASSISEQSWVRSGVSGAALPAL